MTLSTFDRSAAALIMAAFTLLVQNIHQFRCISPFRAMTFTARGGLVTFIFNIMVAVGAADAVAVFGRVHLVVKKHVTTRILEHDSDGFFGGFFLKSRVTNHANQ